MAKQGGRYLRVRTINPALDGTFPKHISHRRKMSGKVLMILQEKKQINHG